MKFLIVLTIFTAMMATVFGHPAVDLHNHIETLEGVDGNVGVNTDVNAEDAVRHARSFCCGGGGGGGYRRPYGGGYGFRRPYGDGFRQPFGGGGIGISGSFSQASSSSFGGGFGYGK